MVQNNTCIITAIISSCPFSYITHELTSNILYKTALSWVVYTCRNYHIQAKYVCCYITNAENNKRSITHNLSFGSRATAVCASQSWRTCFRVPWHMTILCSTADRQCVNTICVTITVATVTFSASIARSPDIDRAIAITTLTSSQITSIKLINIQLFTVITVSTITAIYKKRTWLM